MFCRNCGKEIPENAGFCLYCGTDCAITQPTAEETAASGQLKCAHCGYIGEPIVESVLKPIDWVIGILFFFVGGYIYLILAYILRRKKAKTPHCPLCKNVFAAEDLEKSGYVSENKNIGVEAKDIGTRATQVVKTLAKDKNFRRNLRNLGKSAKGLNDSWYVN